MARTVRRSAGGALVPPGRRAHPPPTIRSAVHAPARLGVPFGDPVPLRNGAGMARGALAERLAPALAEALAGLSGTLAAAIPFGPAISRRASMPGSTDQSREA